MQSPPRVHPVVVLSLGTNDLTEVLPVNSTHASPVKAKPVPASPLKGTGKAKKGSKRVEVAVKAVEEAVEETPAVVRAYQGPQYEKPRTDFSEFLYPATAPQFHGEGAHLMLSGRELSLFLVAARDDDKDRERLRQTGYPLPLLRQEQLHLFCGTVNLDGLLAGASIARSSRSTAASTTMPMHPVLNLGSHLSSLSFRGKHCALAVPEGCFLLDLESAAEGAVQLQKYCQSTVVPKAVTPEMALMRDDDDHIIVHKPLVATGGAVVIAPPPPPEPVVRCRALALVQTAVASSASWAGGVVAIDTSDDGATAVSVIAYKHRVQALLRLDFRDAGVGDED